MLASPRPCSCSACQQTDSHTRRFSNVPITPVRGHQGGNVQLIRCNVQPSKQASINCDSLELASSTCLMNTDWPTPSFQTCAAATVLQPYPALADISLDDRCGTSKTLSCLPRRISCRMFSQLEILLSSSSSASLSCPQPFHPKLASYQNTGQRYGTPHYTCSHRPVCM